MMFQQMNFDINDVQNINAEFLKICAEHNGCVGCPLLKEDMQIGNNIVRCETGRKK